MFRGLWAIIGPWLDVKTRARFEVLGSDYQTRYGRILSCPRLCMLPEYGGVVRTAYFTNEELAMIRTHTYMQTAYTNTMVTLSTHVHTHTHTRHTHTHTHTHTAHIHTHTHTHIDMCIHTQTHNHTTTNTHTHTHIRLKELVDEKMLPVEYGGTCLCGQNGQGEAVKDEGCVGIIRPVGDVGIAMGSLSMSGPH
jgi:hypothetical protein